MDGNKWYQTKIDIEGNDSWINHNEREDQVIFRLLVVEKMHFVDNLEELIEIEEMHDAKQFDLFYQQEN
jgi:hypothetical protein